MSHAYLFPGQGSQFVGMGQDLYQQFPEARAIFEAADEQLGFSLSSLCFEGPEETLTDTVNQQPALFVSSMATLAAMQAKAWQAPAYVAGHSLGELTALAASGSLSFEDGLALVQRRGELMKMAGDAWPGGLAAILALDIDRVEAICAQARQETGQPVQVANDNCPGQVVISGDDTALERAMSLAEEAGSRKVVRLPITIAAHSQLMTPAATGFAEAVDNTPIAAPYVPVIGNTTARPMTTPDEIRDELKSQLMGSVRWTETVQYMVNQGVDTFVEVGPGNVLLNLVKRIDRKSTRLQFEVYI